MIRCGNYAVCLLLICLCVPVGAAQTPQPQALKPFQISTFKYIEKFDWQTTPHVAFFKELLAHHGFEMQLVFLPGKRALRNVELGIIAGDLGRARGASSVSSHLYESSFPFISICLQSVYRRGELNTEPRVVGVQEGALRIEAILRKQWPEVQTVPYRSFTQVVKMLASGRLDMILLPHVGEDYIRELGIIEFDIRPFQEMPLHFIVGEQYRYLLPEIEATARQLLPRYPGVMCR